MLQRVFVADLDDRRRVSRMRIGLVCPYSLDVPGGVQNHVRDLAEVLRRPRPRGRGARARRRRRPLPDVRHAGRAGGAGPLQRLGGPGRASGRGSPRRVRRWLADGRLRRAAHPRAVDAEPVAARAVGGRRAGRRDLPHRERCGRGRCRRRPPIAAARAGEDRGPDRGVRGRPRDPGPARRRRAGGDPERHLRATGSPTAAPRARTWQRPGTGDRVPRPARRAAQGTARAARRLATGSRGTVPGPAAGGRSRRRRGGATARGRADGTSSSSGWSATTTRPRLLSSVDVYVAPQTGGESFGIVLVEAMAAGAPVVASDLAAFRRCSTTAGRGGCSAGRRCRPGRPVVRAARRPRRRERPSREAAAPPPSGATTGPVVCRDPGRLRDGRPAAAARSMPRDP